MFSLLSVCLSVCAHMAAVFQTQYIKATDFKIDKHVHRDSPVMTPRNIFEKRAWPGSRDPLNFWALNANCSNMFKDGRQNDT